MQSGEATTFDKLLLSVLEDLRPKAFRGNRDLKRMRNVTEVPAVRQVCTYVNNRGGRRHFSQRNPDLTGRGIAGTTKVPGGP